MTEETSSRSWARPMRLLKRMSMVLAGVYLFVSAALPILLLVYPTCVKHLVFLNNLRTWTDFTKPEQYGLERVFNFYLTVEPGVRLGVWHYRSPLIEDQPYSSDEEYFQKHLISTDRSIPIVIYFHGNAFDRSIFTRVGMCSKLREELQYDVFTFDYRGFGDSTGDPTEEGVIRDARYVYDWIHNATDGHRKIYIWGQSLGSAIACQLAARLSDDESKSLGGIVLEAAFINIQQAFQSHYMSLLFRWQPWFDGLVARALHVNQLAFQTRGHLSRVNCPCVILHADDDYTVPFSHGKQLLDAALAARKHHREQKELPHFTIDMISFHRQGYGHSRIYRAPKLVPALKRILFEEDL